MLVSFTVQNWRSFKQPETLSMVSSRERKHGGRLTTLPSMYGTTKLLPLAALYGPNASGKSSLIDALGLLSRLVTKGTAIGRPIPVEPNRLDPALAAEPTRFSIRIFVDNRIYEYRVAATTRRVLEESLWLERTRGKKLLYSRTGNDFDLQSTFGSGAERLRFVAEGTRDNELFLHNAISQNISGLMPIYRWFSQRLNVVRINSVYSSYSSMLLRDDFSSFINERLRLYGTGICEVELQEIPREAVNVPDDMLDRFVAELPAEGTSHMQIRRTDPGAQEVYVLTSTNGSITYQKIIFLHEGVGGSMVPFSLTQESEGTRRLISIMPALFELAANGEGGDKVYVIDELDRSIHTALTSDMIRRFLASCYGDSQAQLIFTTHDLLLMDDDTIRRDEQWICENPDGDGSRLTCIGYHKGVCTDTDLLKSYRKGLFGGYPLVSSNDGGQC